MSSNFSLKLYCKCATIGTPFSNLQCYENFFMELTKCGETPPGPSFTKDFSNHRYPRYKSMGKYTGYHFSVKNGNSSIGKKDGIFMYWNSPLVPQVLIILQEPFWNKIDIVMLITVIHPAMIKANWLNCVILWKKWTFCLLPFIWHR